jgi:hypothetical protein
MKIVSAHTEKTSLLGETYLSWFVFQQSLAACAPVSNRRNTGGLQIRRRLKEDAEKWGQTAFFAWNHRWDLNEIQSEKGRLP